MAGITAGGMGSGLDINGLVSQLVQAEGAPAQNRLNRREIRVQTEISALGFFKGALGDFRSAVEKLKDADLFTTRSAKSSNKDLFTVSADDTAAAGSYSVEVQNLAEKHKVISAGFADSATAVGTGTLTLAVNGSSTNITVDSTNNTLAGIRDAINEADAGASAAIISVDDGSGGTVDKLVLTSDETGTANAITVSVTDTGDGNNTDTLGLSALASPNLATVQAAEDAEILLDGQAVTRSSNSIGDVVKGVTIDLKKAEVGTVETLTVELDKGSVKRQVQGFVKSFNALISALDQVTSYNPETKQAAALNGDATVRSVRSQLFSELGKVVGAVEGSYDTLASIGITTSKEGTLELDETELDDVLDTSFGSLAQLFSSESEGVAVRLEKVLDGYLDSDGVIDSRLDSLNGRLEDIADDRERLQARLVTLEQRYLAQFTAMDSLVGQLQSTSSFLTQNLANLPGARKSGGNS